MTLSVSVVPNTTTLAQCQTVIANVQSWFQDTWRCAPAFNYPSAGQVFGWVNDPDVIVVLVRDSAQSNIVVGAAVGQKSTSQILWLLAHPAQFATVASLLCSMAKSRGFAPWGVVESDTVRAQFVGSGNFALDLSRTRPDGTSYAGAIVYTGA